MNSYVFMTDSDSDLPYRYLENSDIHMVYMPYMLDGKEYFDDLGKNGKQKEYFDAMRAGAAPVTSLLPTAAYLEYFEPLLADGKDILFLAFSSKMSSTIQNIYAAREELLAKYPERTLRVVDTLSISAPQFLLILNAYKLYEAGKSMDEVAQWVEDNKLKAQAFFSVDDLKYLRRGGRISAASATLGTMLDLKPIIVEAKNGSLVAAEKVQGRKKAIRTMVERTAQNILNPGEQTVIIMQADAPEDAARLEAMLRERIPELQSVEQVYVGPVIGAHCGPGTVAICFMGKERAI